MTLSRIILIFLFAAFFAHIFYYYPNLPDQIASHFNSRGEADSWTSKQNFLILETIILIIILAEFTLLPLLIQKMPDSLINLPNKDYWLSAENRAKTFEIFRNFMEWFGIGLLGLFIIVNELVFRANLSNQNLSGSVWLVLVVFLIFTGIWLFLFIGKFRRTD